MTTKNKKNKVVTSIKKNENKRKIAISGKGVCNNIINKENINVEDYIRVLRSKKKMLSSSTAKR